MLIKRCGWCVAVMSADAAHITAASSADVVSGNVTGSLVRPSWLAGGCGLLLDPVLAMKLVASRDSLSNVATSCEVTPRDTSTTMTDTSSPAATAAAAAAVTQTT